MKTIKIGKYQHYKGGYYQVLGIARHSDTLEEMVIYQAQYNHPKWGENAVWVRSKEKFLETVEVDNKKVPRFKYLKPESSLDSGKE